ncbi:MAG: DUF5828 family protein, partial [Candidatus Aenigmatarchaeota archaeon]
MTEEKENQEENPGLQMVKSGSWEDIVRFSEKIEDFLNEAVAEDLENGVTQDEIDTLCEEWKNWRPENKDDFCEEMEEKTAQQSSIDESTLEKEGKDATEEIKEAGNSVSKATENAEEEDFEGAKEQLSEAAKCAGRAVDSSIRKGVREVEE